MLGYYFELIGNILARFNRIPDYPTVVGCFIYLFNKKWIEAFLKDSRIEFQVPGGIIPT